MSLTSQISFAHHSTIVTDPKGIQHQASQRPDLRSPSLPVTMGQKGIQHTCVPIVK